MITANKQGFLKRLLMQDSSVVQSEFCWQPMVHMLLRQMWLKKQSLSTRQVSMQLLNTHFLLKTHWESMVQSGMQRPSVQRLLFSQSPSRRQVIRTRMHSVLGDPMNPAEQEQLVSCFSGRHWAFIPQKPSMGQGLTHCPRTLASPSWHSKLD